jgi:hypothetical protein
MGHDTIARKRMLRYAGISTGLTRLATLTTQPLTQACDRLVATLAPCPADDIAILRART